MSTMNEYFIIMRQSTQLTWPAAAVAKQSMVEADWSARYAVNAA